MKTRSYEARILSAALSLLMGMTMLPDIGVQTYAYDVEAVIPETDYLTFTAGTNATIAVTTSSGTFQYQTKAKGAESYGGWSENSSNTSINLDEGESVRFKGSGVTFNEGKHVSVTGSVACSGDVCSLRLDDEGKFSGLENSCFAYMFYNCDGLTTAPKLPATTLADYCYYYMFSDCDGLTTAPALPATQLAYGCYRAMFYDCDGLTTAPELPATTLANYCYYYMFSGCDDLTTAPELSATQLAYGCYQGMFSGCTGLTTAPELPATTLANYCYYLMFSGCTGLTTAPELSATQLADGCYRAMFAGCTSLTEAPALSATTLANRCYCLMFSGCTGIKFSETPTDDCKYEYHIAASTDGLNAPLDNMFLGTTGCFANNGTPTVNKTYYMKKSQNSPAADFTAPTAKTGLKYNGQPQTLITAGKASRGEVQYALGNDETTAPTSGYSTTIPKGTDSGTYFVWYKVVDGEDESDADCVCAGIQAGELDINIVNQKKHVYDGKPLDANDFVFSGTDAALATPQTVKVETESHNAIIDAGSKLACITIKAPNDNYADKTIRMTVTIDRADPLKTAPTTKNPTYSGSAVQLINAGKVVDGCTIQYAVNQDQDTAPQTGWTTDAETITANASGTYYVWYKIHGTINYADVSATPVKVTVSQQNPTPTYYDQTWTLTMDSYEYDGTAHVPTIVGKVHTYANTEVEYTYYNTVTGKELSAAPSEPGKYKVKVFADGGTTHYTRTQWAVYSILEAVSENGQANPASFKDNGVIPGSDGRLFAGWFTDSARTTAYTGETDKAYAKFIDEKILTVKAQISSNTTADSEKTSIRFITSLDSLKYQNVGFKIEFNGQTVDQKLTKVYTTINAGGAKVKPSAFSEESQYMGAFALNGIPNNAFDKEFTVTPYYTTLDGTVVEGETKTFMIADMIK